ncbi:TPR-like protein [Hyaloscypha hepaticicola]|uniref:TPR-like protein n=1 Tax=Hyaloscypha hepaticicola TaxID=2082293 RepID=A0A2J6PUX2_9HELO|nr:TPR-like protein [Hyaloscypha hepaticicola]
MSQVLTLKSSLPNLGGQPRSYTSQEWEAHRSEIKRLYADQNIPLKDVIQIMKTGCSFFATKRQYKTRIRRWGLDKKIKTNEMKIIVRKDMKRKLEEGKETAYFVRNRPVHPRKISRFIKNHDLSDCHSHMSPTPSVISYRTIGPEKMNNVPSEEKQVCQLNDNPDQMEPEISCAIPHISRSALVSVLETNQMTRAGSPEAAESTCFSGSRQLATKHTISKVSFADRSRSRTYTGDMTAMKEFFDFSAAARTDDRSTSSKTHLTLIEAKPQNKEPRKTRKRQEVTSDTESESSALENLNSLIELAGTVEDQGRYEWSRVLLQRVVRIHRQRFGNKHPSTFGALEALSRILRRQGRYSEPDQLLDGALKAFVSTGGPKSLETLLCMGLLALAKVDLGLYHQGIGLARKALEIGRETLDADDPVLTKAKENLGIVLSFEGHHENAEEIYREVLKTRRETLGTEHPKTLNSMHLLAISLGGQKKFVDMEAEYVRKLYIETKTLGIHHPNALNSMHGIARALCGQKQHAKAESIHRAIIAIRQEVSGPEHPHNLTGIHNLAGALRDQGKHDESRALYHQLLEIEKRTIRSEHPWSLTTQANLVSVLDCLGEDEKAEALSRETLQARERVLGAQHTSTLASRNQLARLCEDRGEYVEALHLYGNVLDARRKVLGERHELTVATMASVGRVESAIREDAESVYSD